MRHRNSAEHRQKKTPNLSIGISTRQEHRMTTTANAYNRSKILYNHSSRLSHPKKTRRQDPMTKPKNQKKKSRKTKATTTRKQENKERQGRHHQTPPQSPKNQKEKTTLSESTKDHRPDKTTQPKPKQSPYKKP